MKTKSIAIAGSSVRCGLVFACLAIMSVNGWGQTSGNIGYAQPGAGGKARAQQSERNKRVISQQDLPPTNTGMFVEANILMNVKADEYVAVFGLALEGATIAECTERMDAAIRAFKQALKPLAVRESDIFVDFVTGPKIYTFDLNGDIARERLTGYELKKNVSIHYNERDLIDRLVVAAAQANVTDLIKVDYVVKDIRAIQKLLMQAAATVLKSKTEDYEKLLAARIQPAPQIYAERSSIHYPSDMYDAYTAAESDEVVSPNGRNTIQRARKGKTFFFNGLDGDGFDQVINPVITEPVVQFTLYLKVRYDTVRE
jgi:uncharacterized protein YggE